MAKDGATASVAELREFCSLIREFFLEFVNAGHSVTGFEVFVQRAATLRNRAGGPIPLLGHALARIGARRDARQALRWAREHRTNLERRFERLTTIGRLILDHPGRRARGVFGREFDDGFTWHGKWSDSANDLIADLALTATTHRSWGQGFGDVGQARALFEDLRDHGFPVRPRGDDVRRVLHRLRAEEWRAIGPPLDPAIAARIRSAARTTEIGDAAERLLAAAEQIEVAGGWAPVSLLIELGWRDRPGTDRPNASTSRSIRSALELLRSADVGLLEDNGQTRKRTRYRALRRDGA